MSIIGSMSPPAQDIKWWMYDPSVKPLISYHQLIVKVFTKPILRESLAFDLVERVVKIASIPLGYPVLGLFALIAKVVEKAFGGDFGYGDRQKHIYDAARSGNLEFLRGILFLKRISSYDLIQPLRAAGNCGHEACVEEILKEIRFDELDANGRGELRLCATFINMNGNHRIAVKIMEKGGETPRESR